MALHVIASPSRRQMMQPKMVWKVLLKINCAVETVFMLPTIDNCANLNLFINVPDEQTDDPKVKYWFRS